MIGKDRETPRWIAWVLFILVLIGVERVVEWVFALAAGLAHLIFLHRWGL